jgi:hypothetical protein
VQGGYFDGGSKGRGRLKFTKPSFGQDHIGFHAFKHPFFVDGFLVARVLAVPEVEDFGAHETVFPVEAQVVEPEHEVGIFMPPSLEGFVKSVDTGKVRAPDAKVAAAYAMPKKALFYPE